MKNILQIVFLALLATSSFAQVPQLMNYQGRLLQGTNLVNGSVALSLRLYDAPISGNLLYEDSNDVSVADGIYSTFIGDNTTIGSLAEALTNASAYIEVAVHNVALYPRERVASVAYALYAGSSPSPSGTLVWQTVPGTNVQAQANTGYLLTNEAKVIVTLPTAPLVGDVVRISSVATSGWRLAQNTGQFVTTRNTLEAYVPTNKWTSTASSSDGSKLVAVTDGDQIYTSSDFGKTWTARETNRVWTSVSSSSDGNRLVAGDAGGQIYISSDSGTNWTAHGPNRIWRSVATSSDGSKLVAAANNVDDRIYTSHDFGTNWMARETGRTWRAVACSSDGNTIIAAVNGGQIHVSMDSGTNWVARETNRLWISVACSTDGQYVAAVVSDGQIYVSSDFGSNWTARETNRHWLAIAMSSDGNSLVAAAGNSHVFTSTDGGATWTARDVNRDWTALASSSDGSRIIAVVKGGPIFASEDFGAHWNRLIPRGETTAGTNGFLESAGNAAIEIQYVGNNQFVPLSHAGIINTY